MGATHKLIRYTNDMLRFIVLRDGSVFCFMQEGGSTKLEKAKITLNDCLACSGCITSAESVLITQQSQAELYRALEENRIMVSGPVTHVNTLKVLHIRTCTHTHTHLHTII